jgi:MerR family transcriptional regulator, mercuric resistance operon regulatory protein
MIATRGDQIRIGVVSRRAGLSIDAIRFYERRRLLRSPARSEGGYRLFREEDVETLLFIERAQEMGFSLDEIRELLSLRTNGKACPRVQRVLEGKLAVVSRRISDLRRLEKELAASLDECNAALAKKTELEACPVLRGIAAKPSRRQ